MTYREVKKGDWIVNSTVKDAKPWIVTCKYTGMVVVRRGPKVGKLTAITSRQLREFAKAEPKEVK